MNLGELKAFLGERKQPVGRSELPRQAEQAAAQQANGQQSSSVSLSSGAQSKRFIGVKIFVGALNQSLQIGDRQPKLPEPTGEQKSLFDFEEIAKNVLRFVGGAVKQAKANGASEDKLKEMFTQARNGVLKGVESAKKELGDLMSDEISDGIEKSQQAIEKGIQSLEDNLFGRVGSADSSLQAVSQTAMSYSRQDAGALVIRTRDGDEVTIRFEDARQFAASQSVRLESSAGDEEGTGGQRVSSEQQALFFQRSSFSYSVNGDLDEEELKAIGQLVADAADLADEFFNGDVELAFNQALELGFDEKELTGFAFQLSRQEQVKVIQAYEAVSHFQDGDASSDPAAKVKPIAEYVQHMLDLVEESRNHLESGAAYENLVNGLINKVLKIEVPELIEAINRFHGFNQRLLDNLPSSATAQAEKAE
ncbi:DUF5610 domain-containing protein [Aliiglaciecola sp. CAU 1673]|uniref:DUF5610 domain-containing protein n=1 Tax=Aliiglaciecola sp. CAU 1673 TaxID=3032595 RepID=UPI0023D99FE7|nr:DUF5610 domain-containing protein [Aliiglaciecola sp. CAU 1673]MDF2180339.1 DUF5610 domain-containing protein [Aliiglaciecola sp. CAU 1673]